MKKKKILFWLLVMLMASGLILSSIKVADYVIDAAKQKNEFDELAALVEQSRVETIPSAMPSADAAVPDPTAPENLPAAPTTPTEPSILPEYAPLYERNTDMVGWLTIDGTVINYPVMQTPQEANFYLKKNFSKEYSDHGCLYVRETCDVFAPSDNVTIYGHHMKDGSMFADLEKFRIPSFWEEHQTVNFDTLYEHHSYTIFAVFATTASAFEGFAYHQFENAADEAEFDEFISTCKALSSFDTGITPKYGDKIICLSTCEYSDVNGRLVVAAVRATS